MYDNDGKYLQLTDPEDLLGRIIKIEDSGPTLKLTIYLGKYETKEVELEDANEGSQIVESITNNPLTQISFEHDSDGFSMEIIWFKTMKEKKESDGSN